MNLCFGDVRGEGVTAVCELTDREIISSAEVKRRAARQQPRTQAQEPSRLRASGAPWGSPSFFPPARPEPTLADAKSGKVKVRVIL